MGIKLLDVYNAGGDALKNIFEVEFHNLPSGVGSTTDGYTGLKNGLTSYRTKTFTVPSMGITPYDIDFKTIKIKMPGGKMEFDPKFDTELRIDRYWKVYKDLVVWRNKLANPSNGMIGQDKWIEGNPDGKNTRCEFVLVKTMPVEDASATMLHSWTFSRAFPLTVGDVAFDYAAGENITMTVSFGFVEMKDMQGDVNLGEYGAGGAYNGSDVPEPSTT